jgi:hypothetical protein
MLIVKGKVKGKIQPTTNHESPHLEEKQSLVFSFSP